VSRLHNAVKRRNRPHKHNTERRPNRQIDGRPKDECPSQSHTAEGFAEFFKKIDDIRSSTANLPAPQVGSRATMASFRPFTEAEIRRIIMKSPAKSSFLDPVPTFLLRDFIDVLLPFVTRRPQTYLQRPSSWGRATAGRQDVVSHAHTAKQKVYSLHSSSRQM